MQWLGPFNSLFYVIQEQPNCMINIYDERTNEKEISFKWGNDVIVGCNASLSMPMDLVVADENGKLAIIDLRAMGEVERSSLGRTVKQFEVHRQLPIGMGVVDNSVFALMFNDGLRPDYLGNINIDSFCLHNSDASCAIRIGNKVENIDIRIDV
ncbi:hypothetical protein GPJ56_008955 [Histomonas meleagridis]|uniref:uncharacterized protein n=1 Tax=Histomonas meleagridis TaxID=135588 RepID=UPI00355A4D48|nr:hypothetical protein GPJ56_008955 [Histomonas meleagridis]KAH0805690.1 hypothetical protein GO595_001531 [Histomonas meleagridis]